MNIKIMLYRNKFNILIFILVFFLLGFFVTEYIFNQYTARYVYVFESPKENMVELLDKEFYDEIFEKIDEYNETATNKISYAKIDYAGMLKTAKLSKNEYFEFSVLMKFFPSTVRTNNGLVNKGKDRVVKYFNLVLSESNIDFKYIELRVDSYQNPFIIGSLCSLFGIIVILTLCFVGVKKKGVVNIEDNVDIYSSIFHRSYWKKSMSFINNVKNLCTISILFALMMLCKMIPIPSGFGRLGLGVTYLVFASITLIYGPICGMVIGFSSDILGFFLFQSSHIFFPGYTLDAILTGFLYGVFFYKKKITFTSCLAVRTIINLFINVICGSFWWKIIFNLDVNSYLTYMTITSLPKNLIYLLPQSILLYICLKGLVKPLARFGLVNNKIAENVTLF